MENEKQVIEINGIKMEVDLRHAKRIDTFRVGDPVKILIAEGKEVKAGIIVSFEEFRELPTIVVAYINSDYYNTGLKFAYINSKSSSEYEIILSDKDTLLAVDKASIIESMDNEIAKKEIELSELKRKKDYFITRFGVYFGDVEKTVRVSGEIE